MIYLATSYSHDDPAVRRKRFETACVVAARLMSKSDFVFSPICHTHPMAEAGELPKGFYFWEMYDTWFIERCDKLVVVMMDGWRESQGVAAEIKIAKALGKPVFYMKPDGDEYFSEFDAGLSA